MAASSANSLTLSGLGPPQFLTMAIEQLPVSRPAVSQHLKVLKETGLVSDEAVGTRHIYRLNPAGVSALRDQLDTFWSRALAGYEATIGETEEES